MLSNDLGVHSGDVAVPTQSYSLRLDVLAIDAFQLYLHRLDPFGQKRTFRSEGATTESKDDLVGPQRATPRRLEKDSLNGPGSKFAIDRESAGELDVAG